MIKQCCETPRYNVCYIPFMSKTWGYDLIDKTEKPKYPWNSSYGSERSVCDYERSPEIVRVLLKSISGNFNFYGDHYDIMRQLPIVQQQYDNVTRVRLENRNFKYYNFKLAKGIQFISKQLRRPLTAEDYFKRKGYYATVRPTWSSVSVTHHTNKA